MVEYTNTEYTNKVLVYREAVGNGRVLVGFIKSVIHIVWPHNHPQRVHAMSATDFALRAKFYTWFLHHCVEEPQFSR